MLESGLKWLKWHRKIREVLDARHLFTCTLPLPTQCPANPSTPRRQDHWTSLEFQVPSCHSPDPATHKIQPHPLPPCMHSRSGPSYSNHWQSNGAGWRTHCWYPSEHRPHIPAGFQLKQWMSHPIRPIWPPKPSQAHCSWCSNGPTNSGSKTWEESAISNHSIRWYLVPTRIKSNYSPTIILKSQDSGITIVWPSGWQAKHLSIESFRRGIEFIVWNYFVDPISIL